MNPPLKRRRIDGSSSSASSNPTISAAQKLCKPFKSPLKSELSNAKGYPFPSSTAASPHLSNDTTQQPSSSTTTTAATSTSAPPTAPTSSSKNTAKPSALAPSLQAQIQSLTSTLHTLSQAASLLTAQPPPDEELAALTLKWRKVAQAAAEEVYGSSRDRVNKMGGVGAWRAREREKRERWEGKGDEESESEEEDESEDDCDEEADEEEKETRRTQREEARREQRELKQEARAERARMKAQMEAEAKEASKGRDGEVIRDDDSFTMEMMLKTLNVDPNVIGWDHVEGKWVD